MLAIKLSNLPLNELIQSPDYASLINPFLVAKIKAQQSLTHWVAGEARVNDELAALAIAEIYPLNRVAKLESLEIKEHFKGQGIWRSLFVFMQDLLANEKKIRAIEWTFDQSSPSAPAIEKILASLGWPPSKLFLMRLHFDAYAFDAPWIHRTFRLPSAMQLFAWKDLLPEDRNTIAYLGQQGRFLPYLSPLFKEESVDLETSVGLRKAGKLIGWSVTRRPDPSTILYASLYIDSSLLRSGYGIQLLIQSIHLHKALPIPNALFEISLQTIDPSWWHFVNKRLMPLASKIERIKQTLQFFPQKL